MIVKFDGVVFPSDVMAHSAERPKYLTDWARQHRARLPALPLTALKKLRPTVYTIQKLHRHRVEPR